MSVHFGGRGMGHISRMTSLSSGTSLPTGAMGLWLMSDYSASPRPTVKNRIAASAVSPNLLTASRRLFNNTTFWSNTACTVVDGVSGSIDGTSNASTVAWGNANAFLQVIITSLANNTQVTLSFDAMTTDASTVSIRTGMFPSPTTISVTPTWQRFSTTFTYTTGNAMLLVYSLNTSTPANLKIDNATLHLGAVDLGRDTLDGHIMFGAGIGATTPGTGTAGLLDVSNGSGGISQFLADQSLSSFTAVVIGSRTQITSTSILQTAISKLGSGYTSFALEMETGVANGGAVHTTFGGSAPISGQNPGLWVPRANELHMFAQRYGDGAATVFHNDVKAKYVASTGLPIGSVKDYMISWLNNPSFYARYKFAVIALWPRALSDAELRTAYDYLKSTLTATSGLSVNPTTKFVCAEGDSITAGLTVTGGLGAYCDRAGINLTGTVGVNNSVGSAVLGTSSDPQGTNSLWGRTVQDLAVIPPNKNGRTFILSVLIGRNDILGYSGGASQYVTNLAAYLAYMKAGGYDKVVLCTVLPSTLANFNTARNAVNTIINGVGWAAANGVDAICDFASVAGMGADGDAANATNYTDGTHPTTAGQVLLEPLYRATINAL